MTFLLKGFGSAFPVHGVDQVDAADLHVRLGGLADPRRRVLRALYRRSGVRRRGSVLLERGDGPLSERQRFFQPADEAGPHGPSTGERMGVYSQEAPGLAIPAARRALESAGVEAPSVTHLVTVSCTGFMSPGVDWHLMEALGLSAEVARTHVGFMGCHGALNALGVAQGCTAADPEAVVLVCAVELCSLHFAYKWDPDMLVANALFADGAGALVGVGQGRATDPPAGDAWRVVSSGSVVLPGSGGDMGWTIGSHGFRMTLSARVPEVIGRYLSPWMSAWLARSGLSVDDVRTWAVHPGGPRIVDAVEGALGLERGRADPSRDLLREHGNMSSATVIVLLERLRKANAPLPAVALAFGPGLVAEAVLIL